MTGRSDALVVVDVQKGFLPGGSLAVKGGDEIIPLINRIARKFENVVLTQDWHMPGHVSFASSHRGKQAFDTIELAYGTQVLWPEHCVQGTDSAEFAASLAIPQAQAIVRKGFHRNIDSYSAFIEADRKTPTGLEGYLRTRGIETLYLCGLATDYCVAWTALDARRLGFETHVVEDACRAIDAQGSLAQAWSSMEAAGVRRMLSENL